MYLIIDKNVIRRVGSHCMSRSERPGVETTTHWVVPTISRGRLVSSGTTICLVKHDLVNDKTNEKAHNN